jgi:hypothetical protein
VNANINTNPNTNTNIPLNEKNQIRASASNNKNGVNPSPGLIKKASMASNNIPPSNVRKSFSHTQNNPILKNSGVLNNPNQKVPTINVPNMQTTKETALSSRFNNQKVVNTNGAINYLAFEDDSLMDIESDMRDHNHNHYN